jgi:hypothetical protein
VGVQEQTVSSQQTNFYQSQADEARARSDAASLQNVKDSQLRAAEAWEALAARSRKADLTRSAEATRKAALGLTSS